MTTPKTTLNRRFNFHYDADHGWLEVDYAEIEELGCEDQISESSYRDGEKVFLEEDRDLAIFVKSFEGIVGSRMDFNDINDGMNSPIRNMARFCLPA